MSSDTSPFSKRDRSRERMKSIVIRLSLLFLILLMALGWWSFANPPQLTPSGSEYWSKGSRTGIASLSQPVAIQADWDGVYLVWIDQANRLHYAFRNTENIVRVDKFLPIATLFPRSPQLLWGPDSKLHLAWLDGQGSQSLYYVQLNDVGNMLLDEPVIISAPAESVNDFQMAFNQQNELEMFWSNAVGLFHATLDNQGQTSHPPSLLRAGGDRPALQVDKNGLFHLVFLEPFGSLNHHVLYSTFDPSNKSFAEPLAIDNTFRRGGQLLEGPTIGIDLEYVYLFWSVIDSRDVNSNSFYTSFPITAPQPTDSASLVVSGGSNPSGIQPLAGQRRQMVFAISSQVFARGEREFQALTGVFSKGQLEGYQIISASRDPSLKPALAADKGGNLHGVWLDAGRFQTNQIVYATTNPEIKLALSGTTLHDIVDGLFGLILSLALVVGVLPFLAIWGVVPLLIALGYFFATGQETLQQRSSWWALGIASASQILIMIIFSPDNSYLSAVGRVVLPILLALPATVLLYYLTMRWDVRSFFAAFFTFILTHGLLRLLVFTLFFAGT